ncbi:MAG: hypothetical protein ACRD6U_09625, partial [Nitrososphaeraceae archaeon]
MIVFPTINFINNSQLLPLLSNNKTTKKNFGISGIFLVFFASSLVLLLSMFYMHTSYGQIEGSTEDGLEDIIGEQQPPEEECPEGQRYNEATLTCEPTAEEPTAEEPTAEEPTAEEPTAEEPTAEE